MYTKSWLTMLSALLVVFVLVACQAGSAPTADPSGSPATALPAAEEHASGEHDHDDHPGEFPALQPVTLAAGERLHAVATTSLIADAVRRVAGDLVDLTVLMPAGSDPHSYVATPQDMALLEDAHAIFVNGLGLEESLIPTLESLENKAAVVEVNLAVEPIELAEDEADAAAEEHDHHHEGIDPHTWQEIANVQVWVENIEHALSELDPANAASYASAATAYGAELGQLDQEVRATLDAIPADKRKLVTDHDTFSYFAPRLRLRGCRLCDPIVQLVGEHLGARDGGAAAADR
jgi:ABC-type Zn uptake system ZnuABC Zn-binding protein ZnuA